MSCIICVPRKPWSLPFIAVPREVAVLRRILRLHLDVWQVPEVVDVAQVCVSELASNVITHVGLETPATLAVSMNGSYLRVEVHDPDPRALPTLVQPQLDSEAGRGMVLIDVMADRWGIELHADRKVTWCEMATELPLTCVHAARPLIAAVDDLLNSYRAKRGAGLAGAESEPLALVAAEEAAIDIIADLLRWMQAHGRDADEVLDRAQTYFEAQAR
ncbi:ATP-binding protein [Streptomyces malaysiense]|uniref:ATP-binding protein n=1 Tax=Streptomyces malaysiense TaxID=1428626 RepID=A0A1J4PQN1_9ACTN|nr:ATP-binding protein [Streptomyces malaysiense]OIK23221.1 ATP-binding protein [Streptomyces malaysiense]